MLRAAGAVGVSMLASCSASPGDTVRGGAAAGGEPATLAPRCATESVSASAVRVARDVTYARRDGRALTFDVAWSESGPPAPLVLLLHGGSWSGGSPASLQDEMHALARRGYTAATVEYRLTQAPRNVFPAAIADVRCALRTLRRRAADSHIAPDRVAAMGYSAGGHLASLLGTGSDLRELDAAPCDAGGESVRVQAVVSYAGPQDLRVNGPYTREQAEIVTNFLGVFPGDDPATARLASPIAHVGAGDPPFLLVHGTNDDLVPVSHPRRMAEALQKAGTPASLIELPRIGHGFVGFVTGGEPTVRCTVEAFLARWLGDDASSSNGAPAVGSERGG
jgi:acetyl esterase/lipase